MENYPANQQAFEQLLTSEEACRSFLADIRWSEGFHCPTCGSPKAWQIVTNRWECGECGRQTSVTAGTLFQDTRYPLRVWFQAIWYVTGQKYGASALGLQRLLGLGELSSRVVMVAPPSSGDGLSRPGSTIWNSPSRRDILGKRAHWGNGAEEQVGKPLSL